MKKSTHQIKILPNGPYQVSAGVVLNQAHIVVDEKQISTSWKKGKVYKAAEEPYHLCRCGRSGKTPYCDGTHEKIEFSGTETADNLPYEKAAEFIPGKVMDLLDQERLCAYARFCDRAGRIWNIVENGADQAAIDVAVQESWDCPAGRLTVVDKQGNKIEPELEPEISLIQDAVENCKGPLWVKGGICVEGADGTLYEQRNRVTLCRCGESVNKPFCDGTHVQCLHMQELDK